MFSAGRATCLSRLGQHCFGMGRALVKQWLTNFPVYSGELELPRTAAQRSTNGPANSQRRMVVAPSPHGLWLLRWSRWPRPYFTMAIAACAIGPCSLLFGTTRGRRGVPLRLPLQGPTSEAMVPAASREALPDSMVVLTMEGRLLLSRATLRFTSSRRLGGMWKLLAGVCRVCFRGCCATRSMT